MICPICLEDNRCGKNDSSICWCVQVIIPTSLITKLPSEQRGKTCICQNCVEKSKNSLK